MSSGLYSTDQSDLGTAIVAISGVDRIGSPESDTSGVVAVGRRVTVGCGLGVVGMGSPEGPGECTGDRSWESDEEPRKDGLGVTWTPNVLLGRSVGIGKAVIIGWEVNPVGIGGDIAVRLARNKFSLQVRHTIL